MEADTIDRMIDESFTELCLLDLRTCGPESTAAIGAAKRMRSQDQALEIDVRQAFDMLVHVPRITRWTSATNDSLPDERAAAK
jgi:hypothetical protein